MVPRPAARGLTLPAFPQIRELLSALTPSNATSLAASLDEIQAPALQRRWLSAIVSSLHAQALSHPSTSIDAALVYLHTLDRTRTVPLPDGLTVKRAFATHLAAELRSLIQPTVTPRADAENRLALPFYAVALANGLLVARLLAGTPAPHDASEELDHVWTALVQPVLVRALFTDEAKASVAPGNAALLPALLAGAAASIRDYLLLRRKGRGRGYVWYDDACARPDEEWTWDDVVARARRGFNAAYRPQHRYPEEVEAFWTEVGERLAATAADDLEDQQVGRVLERFAVPSEEVDRQVEETVAVQAEVVQMVARLQEVARRVENRFAVGPNASATRRFLALEEGGVRAKVEEARELVERAAEKLDL